MASIEHVLILAGQPEAAQEYAEQMPEEDVDCRLAKAEALSAAGAAWLRADNSVRANADFDKAISLVKSVSGFALGKVSVMLTIASAQFKGGLTASSGISLNMAKEIARALPLRPKDSKRPVGIHYRDEAYQQILVAAIRTRDLGSARETAELWKQSGGKIIHPSCVPGWQPIR